VSDQAQSDYLDALGMKFQGLSSVAPAGAIQ
jgi:hypothetical protein